MLSRTRHQADGVEINGVDDMIRVLGPRPDRPAAQPWTCCGLGRLRAIDIDTIERKPARARVRQAERSMTVYARAGNLRMMTAL